ncbi:MAG TPA: hypothetical protein VKN99_14235 [Polyangia bacterium]|nr:hypothetical protein [Polyangia bacterium]
MKGLRAYWPVLACAPLLLAHIALFNFVTDDAYITFVYTRNLARHGQLVFNLGERVEGYTNFLWAVLLAGVMRLGVGPALASRVLGAGFALGTLVVTVRMARRISGESPWNLVAPLLLAGCGGFACWSSGGLETAMFTFLVTLGFALHLEDSPWAGLWFALGAMTRPEGNLLYALAALHRLIAMPERRIDWRALALYVGAYGPYFAWRYHYYGWLFPNTFYIKSSGGVGTWRRGLFYLGQFARDYGLWFVLPLLCPPLRRARRLWGLTLTTVLGFGGYVVVMGGDFMGLYRFLVPVLPLCALTAQEALRRLPGRAALAVTGLLLLAYAPWSARVSYRANTIVRDDPPGSGIDMPAYLRKFTDDRARIGRWFGQYVQPSDLMSVGGAGAQVYYADVRALDAFGLNDLYVAHKVPSHSSRPGHQKWAPDSYILSRNPTIMCHLYKITGTPYLPAPWEAQHWRSQGWRWVSVAIPGLDPPYYNFLLRRDRALGPIGVDLAP